MIKISGVLPGSIAEEAELQAGDELLTVNGKPLQDLIDYQYLTSEELVTLHVRKKDGEELELEIEKDADEAIGLHFASATFDGVRRCHNRCSFCFIRQNPPGLRSSLYIYDDDYRLSFLHGHFVSLTNLRFSDWRRIARLHLSPLYVSVHVTDPDLREKMLGTKKARCIRRQLRFLADHGIKMHVQIVLCPGVNDGRYLDQTLQDLTALYPAVESVAVVPVGLTKYRENLPPLRPFTKDEAKQLLDEMAAKQDALLHKLGTRFVWMADEFYLTHGLPMPPASVYEDMPQLENGVGLVRDFADEFRMALAETEKKPRLDSKVSIGTGILGAKALAGPVEELQQLGVAVQIWAVENNFFGKMVTASGLVTGGDLVAGLQGLDLGAELLIPSQTVREHEGDQLFLDGTSLEEVENSLGVKITPLSSAADLVHYLVR